MNQSLEDFDRDVHPGLHLKEASRTKGDIKTVNATAIDNSVQAKVLDERDIDDIPDTSLLTTTWPRPGTRGTRSVRTTKVGPNSSTQRADRAFQDPGAFLGEDIGGVSLGLSRSKCISTRVSQHADLSTFSTNSQTPMTQLKLDRPWTQHSWDPTDNIESHTKPAAISWGLDGMDGAELLKTLQNQGLQRISRTEQHKQRVHSKLDTTSLRDLDLARRRVDPNNVQASIRRWAPESVIDKSAIDHEENQANTSKLYDQNVHDVQRVTPRATSTRARWATKEEMRAPDLEADENAWGSAAPSDVTKDSNNSDRSFGKMLNKRIPGVHESSLRDWQGNFAPPPADWSERVRYNNNNDDFKKWFKNWQADVKEAPKFRFSNGIDVPQITPQMLNQKHLVPDGLSLVDRLQTIGEKNAEYYGYTYTPADVIKYVDKVTRNDFDQDWAKLDLRDPDNQRHKDEVPKQLIDNWNAHYQNTQRLAKEQPENRQMTNKAVPDPITTLACETQGSFTAVYLRPALQSDLDELTRIYNDHITNGVRPVETAIVNSSSMLHRFQTGQECKLPFIVAAKRNTNNRSGDNAQAYKTTNRSSFTTKGGARSTKQEQLAGFCYAQDLSAPDYVDYISAELELYVDRRCRNMGVGKCLLDKVLEICDASHRKRTECAFHVDPVIRHLYNPGGDRQVHKIYFVLRKWHKPKSHTKKSARGGRKQWNRDALAAQEDEYEQWLKPWLESYGFEEEGCLKKNAAKNGRYIDTVYLGKETLWQPEDGQIPPPDPRLPCYSADNSTEED